MEKQSIVVADDDPIVVRFLTSIFEGEGFVVHGAEDGEHALRLIRDARPDLVILDLVMPFMDGFEVCRRLRTHAETNRLPVIILSMKEREQDAIRAFEMGADDYVRKPFNALELVARARKLLSDRTERRG